MAKFDREDKGKTGTLRKISEYLFSRRGSDEEGKIDLDFLLMRTDIRGRESFNNIAYYTILHKHLKSNLSGEIAKICGLIYISTNREGRKEGVEAMKAGQFPQIEKLLQGYEREKIKSGEEGSEEGP